MSQENVVLVRATNAAWNAGDMNAFRELKVSASAKPTSSTGSPGREGTSVGRRRNIKARSATLALRFDERTEA
jgi:hypothetical protein